MSSTSAYIGLIAGGHAAGKRTVSRDIQARLSQEANVPIDVHLVDLGDYQTERYGPHVDFAKVNKDIEKLTSESTIRGATAVILIHGNYALYDSNLCTHARLKIFVDTDADTRLSQWILRDVSSDGNNVGKADSISDRTLGKKSTDGKRLLEDVLDEYLAHCRPEYHNYIEDTKKRADVLLPRGSDALGISVLASSVVDDVRQYLVQARGWRSHSATPINLRHEAFSGQDQRYYTAI